MHPSRKKKNPSVSSRRSNGPRYSKRLSQKSYQGTTRKRGKSINSSKVSLRGLILYFGGSAAVCLLLLLSMQIWRRTSATLDLQPTLPQDPLIQAYFNHNASASYTEPYRDRHRLGDDLEQVIIDAIATAKVSVDVAVQEFQLPRIANALKEKQDSGIPVRVILENQYSRSWSDYTPEEIQSLDDRRQSDYMEFRQFVDVDGDRHISQTELLTRDALSILQAANIPVLDDTADGSKGSGLMHHKFVLIDGKQVIVGSLNFTLSGSHGDWASETSFGNANHLVNIQSSELATLFKEEFELMWGDGPGGHSDSQFGLQKPYRPPQSVVLSPTSSLTVQFSPTSSSRYSWEESANGLISRILNQSQNTVDLALFVFSEQPLSHALQEQQRRHVTIRALIDAGFAYRSYSEALDLMGVALPNNRCRYDTENRPWTQPLTTVGVPTLDDGDVLHHKFGVIDRQIVITGSQNWSNAANTNNDEAVVVIDNATVAAHFQQEFERLYETAELGIPGWLQDKIQSQGDRCSSTS